MENKFREFWIELEEKGARAFVYTEPVDGLNDDAIHAVEYAALESANDKIAEKIAKLKEENAQLSKYCGEVRYWQNRAEDLSEENKKLSEHLESVNAEIERYKLFAEHEFKIKDKLYAENTRLRAALEHIASPKHWAIDTFVPEIRDRVKIARDALKKWSEV